jgi:beta-glucuronidase
MLNLFVAPCRRLLRAGKAPSSWRGRFWLAASVLWLVGGAVAAKAAEPIDLGGTWRFAIDPVQRGEENGWHQPGLVVRDWSEVQTPHCWSIDPRFPHVGTVWYRRTFRLPPDAAGKHARLAFARVFHRAKVWINGHLAGAHVGGYTPFEIEVTPWLRPGAENTIAVLVDNAWTTETLPGARLGPKPQEQVYPWREYGGILGSVRLLLTAPVFVANLRVVAEPNLADGTAAVALTAFVRNATEAPARVRLGFTLERDLQPVEAWAGNRALAVEAELPPRAVTPVSAQVRLRPDQVRRWGVDHPQLYSARAALLEGERETETGTTTFGIRKVEARAGKLLLNGEPIRMGGGNRHSDHPQFGSIDPAEVVETDLRQMKRANMELMRITHYPVEPRILDWADRHGLLIIEEGLNWQLTEPQMDSPTLRANFQAQMREMIERDWNHPSVIGWSVGNEYPSFSPAGMRWTKDMIDWVRTVDNTRLLTFASHHAFSEKFTSPDEEGSRYVDLICINMYDNFARRLDLVHSRWPDKPVLVSEYGFRADAMASEEARREAHRQVIEIFRARPYVAGASVWTYNDYRSRYPQGTDARGYRQWGVVDAERREKPTYALLADEYSPALIRDVRVLADASQVSATIQARADFPSYTLRDYTVRVELLDAAGKVAGTSRTPLPVLRPGETYRLDAAIRADASAKPARARIEVVRPTEFVMTAVEVIVP